MMNRRISARLLLGSLLSVCALTACLGHSAQDAGQRTFHGMPYQEGRHALAKLSWDEPAETVRYEMEMISSADKVDANEASDHPLWANDRIYMPAVMLDPADMPKPISNVSWRVRSLDFEGDPVTPFSKLLPLKDTLSGVSRTAPLPRDTSGEWNLTLLYPVYSYLPNPKAASYEVEVLSDYPEEIDGTLPSEHRVLAKTTTLTDLYDPSPRMGTWYWRVRAMDQDGAPLGEWSLPVKYRTSPGDGWETGIYGDSVTHGGGHISYSPADQAYSYASYLEFPVINLAQSGDTIGMMDKRFERDVLPFHVKTLLIMGGINSIRAGESADAVIAGLEDIRQKCIENNIRPVLLTIPPINPDAIMKTFHEPTAPEWRHTLDAVNAYIRTVPHIDTAAPFGEGNLADDMALDGLHGDAAMKKIMGEIINEHIEEFGVKKTKPAEKN